MAKSCVFINTTEQPVKIVRQGVFRYGETSNGNIQVAELCQVFYKHPDAPGEAIINMLQWLEVDIQPGTDKLFKMNIEAMGSLTSISKVRFYSESIIQKPKHY